MVLAGLHDTGRHGIICSGTNGHWTSLAANAGATLRAGVPAPPINQSVSGTGWFVSLPGSFHWPAPSYALRRAAGAQVAGGSRDELAGSDAAAAPI